MPKSKKDQDEFSVQFRKIIIDIMNEQKYFKEEDVKTLMKEILENIEPLIAKQVKKHFNEIGFFIVKHTEEKSEITNGEDNNA